MLKLKLVYIYLNNFSLFNLFSLSQKNETININRTVVDFRRIKSK